MRQSGKNNGYFTLHNVKFQPSAKDPEYVQKDDCVASDIDVVGFHPKRKSYEQVWAVSCKSWQAGFDPRRRIELINANRKVSGRLAWQAFRELVKKKWVMD
jgi:hypothetical protein